MDHVLLALQETKDERDLIIQALFDFFDATNLGYLDYPQIKAGLSALQIPSHYKYAKDLFKVCDTPTTKRGGLKSQLEPNSTRRNLWPKLELVLMQYSFVIAPFTTTINNHGSLSRLCWNSFKTL